MAPDRQFKRTVVHVTCVLDPPDLLEPSPHDLPPSIRWGHELFVFRGPGVPSLVVLAQPLLLVEPPRNCERVAGATQREEEQGEGCRCHAKIQVSPAV